MDFFRFAAPVYDLAMKLTGHDKSLEQLVQTIDFSSGERLLDVGGGTGRLAKLLPAGLEIVVVDSSPAMLNRAEGKKRSAENYQLVEGKAEDLPFGDDSFDYVVCADALHHFSGIRESLEEMVRVLKSGGELKILEFTPEHWFTRAVARGEKMMGEPADFRHPEELGEMLQAVGCSVEQKELSAAQYILTADSCD